MASCRCLYGGRRDVVMDDEKTFTDKQVKVIVKAVVTGWLIAGSIGFAMGVVLGVLAALAWGA